MTTKNTPETMDAYAKFRSIDTPALNVIFFVGELLRTQNHYFSPIYEDEVLGDKSMQRNEKPAAWLHSVSKGFSAVAKELSSPANKDLLLNDFFPKAWFGGRTGTMNEIPQMTAGAYAEKVLTPYAQNFLRLANKLEDYKT